VEVVEVDDDGDFAIVVVVVRAAGTVEAMVATDA
jgi:hypothetical protein